MIIREKGEVLIFLSIRKYDFDIGLVMIVRRVIFEKKKKNISRQFCATIFHFQPILYDLRFSPIPLEIWGRITIIY